MDDARAPEGSLESLAAAVHEDEAGSVATTAAALAAAGKAARIAAFVEDWWRAHFPGSAIGRTTEAWNVAHAAKEDLKHRLQEH